MPPREFDSDVLSVPAVKGVNTSTPTGAPPESVGVAGQSNLGVAVAGHSMSGFGVYGFSQSNFAVRAESMSGTGLRATSESGRALEATAKTGTGEGVVGQSDGGPGVLGLSNTSDGVVGRTNSGIGVFAVSVNAVGLRAVSETGRALEATAKTGTGEGVVAQSDGGLGVLGISNALNFMAGVSGLAANVGGVGPGVMGQSNGLGPGVFGTANKDSGVTGFHGDPRLQETTVANNGAQAGVFGASDVGSGVVAYTRNPAVPALYAFGGLRSFASTNAMAAIFDGNVQVNGDIFLPGADCAEHFDMQGGVAIEPGSVVVINDDGAMRQSAEAYDKKVAGVISGAGTHRPGIILDRQSSGETRQPVALVGKVYCKVDAQYSPISVGDLLTSSPTPGHAMKATDPSKAFGAVLGKALSSLPAGIGQVPILVCLQ